MKCDSDSIAVAILAGGDGSRMGGGKPLRMLGGRPLIAHALELAGRWSGDVVVAGREPEQAGTIDVPFLHDAPGAEGPIAGLAAALRHAKDAGHGALLAIPCDSPLLPDDLAARLAGALTPKAGAALASSGGVLHPACGLWRVRSFFLLGQYLASGRRSLRGFAQHIGFATAEWPCAPVDPFFNINTAEELAIAETLLA